MNCAHCKSQMHRRGDEWQCFTCGMAESGIRQEITDARINWTGREPEQPPAPVICLDCEAEVLVAGRRRCERHWWAVIERIGQPGMVAELRERDAYRTMA